MPTPVTFGNCTFDYPSAQLGELVDSAPLRHDPAALRDRLASDGYLLLRGLIPRDTVLAARRAILDYMAEHEGLEPGSRPLDGVMGFQGKSVPLMGRRPITHEPAVAAVLEGPELFAFYRDLFAQDVLTFDYKWLRAVGHEEFTGCHYDVVYMGRGTPNLLTCWVPLGDIPIDQGVLAICKGSHADPGFARLRETYGRMDVDRDHVDGWFSKDPAEITARFGGQWLTGAFQAGDILTFGMHTMHASTTNTTDRWRLSCDVRFQPAADPVDERWVGVQPKGHYAWATDRARMVPMATAREQWGV